MLCHLYYEVSVLYRCIIWSNHRFYLCLPMLLIHCSAECNVHSVSCKDWRCLLVAKRSINVNVFWFNLGDKQLNSSMQLISGTLCTTQLPWLPVLTNIPPRNICLKAACHMLLQIVENHPEWPVYQDFFNHSPPRLTSRKPIWSDLSPADTSFQWRAEWQSVFVANKNLISDPTTRHQSRSFSVVYVKPLPYWTGLLCC